MDNVRRFRLRKATDINREFAIFELLANDVVVLDVGFSDSGVLEVAFSEGIAGLVVEWERLKEFIEQGRAMAERDRE